MSQLFGCKGSSKVLQYWNGSIFFAGSNAPLIEFATQTWTIPSSAGGASTIKRCSVFSTTLASFSPKVTLTETEINVG